MSQALGTLPPEIALQLFTGCTLVIGIVGTRLARLVDELADRTGLGRPSPGPCCWAWPPYYFMAGADDRSAYDRCDDA